MESPVIALAPQVYRIPTVRYDLVNSFALVDDDGSVTLIDCGLRRAPARIVAGLAAIGKHPRDVRRIVLTHVHTDHAGGAAQIARRTGGELALHTDEAPYLRSGRMPPNDRGTRLGQLVGRVRDRRTKPDVDPFEPGQELVDGQLLDAAGGLRVVHTPGHSPGHISLLHEPTGVLVTGDAIFNLRRLRWPVATMCTDFALTQRTAQRLADLNYTVAAFTHGPHLADRARERVRGFLADAERTGNA